MQHLLIYILIVVQTLRLARSKQALRKKASTLFGKEQRDIPALPRIDTKNILLISSPLKVGRNEGALETEPRPTLPEHGVAVLEKDSESNSSVETMKAVAITEMAVDEPSNNDTVPDALIPEAYVIQPSSPTFSWIATPACKIGRYAISKNHYRSLVYDPSATIEFIKEALNDSEEADGAKANGDDFEKDTESEVSTPCWKKGNEEFATMGATPCGNANITSSREWSSGDDVEEVTEAQTNATFFDEAQLSIDFQSSPPPTCGPDAPIRARTRPAGPVPENATFASSLIVSLADSDAFDAVLLEQAEAAKEREYDAASTHTVIIHSDAVFLESAMEVNTSSAVPSSGSKPAPEFGPTVRVQKLVRQVEVERNELSAQNQKMMAAFQFASSQSTEYRAFIDQLRDHKDRQERKLNGHIQFLQAAIDEKNGQMQQMQEYIAAQQDVETTLKQTIEEMVGDGFTAVGGDEAAEVLRSTQS
jgi:hypothetical protein